jgi:hypothetical protein
VNLRLVLVLLLVTRTAQAQPAGADSDGSRWHGTVSLSNLFDGNINHELDPIRSYGIVPAADLVFESSSDPAFVFGYEIASNRFTGTDEWDRVSHSMYSVWSYRLGSRLRMETEGGASFKGSSEDRELANEFGVSQRLAYRLRKSTRILVVGAYRYKQYSDDPGTSGPSPYIATKFDQKFTDGRRLTIGYKYQRRLSITTRDRYRRSAYTVDYSMPVFTAAERLSFEVEYRPQRYERLIKLPGRQELRADRRFLAGAAYERPLNRRTVMRWMVGVETRASNDPTKHFIAPTFGATVSYRVR